VYSENTLPGGTPMMNSPGGNSYSSVW